MIEHDEMYIDNAFNAKMSNVLWNIRIDVLSDVPPQGSHLGLLLFNLCTLFIDDLSSVIRNSKTLMYADDIKIFLSFNNIEDQVLI